MIDLTIKIKENKVPTFKDSKPLTDNKALFPDKTEVVKNPTYKPSDTKRDRKIN